MDKPFRPHTELTDILCEFVNENQVAIEELKGGEPIPQKILDIYEGIYEY